MQVGIAYLGPSREKDVLKRGDSSAHQVMYLPR